MSDLSAFSNVDKKAFVHVILCLQFKGLPNEIIIMIIYKFANYIREINYLASYAFALEFLSFPFHSRLKYTN